MNGASQHPYEELRYLPPDRCSDEALISMSEITKTFKNASSEFTALKSITACFYPGEFVSIVGKSGSGKSTLVNMLTGIDHPTSGSVRVEQTYIHKMTENDMSLWRGRNLGIVFQFFQLMPILTLLENVMLPMALAGIYRSQEREQRARQLLNLVGLGSVADKLPAAVSGGQQQSAAIARALANDPPILIADEPTGNLDSRSADEIFKLFSGLIDQGKTILMVTHDPGLAKRTNRSLLLADGELINPCVAEAFPNLLHAHMLWLTKHMQPKLEQPGALIAGDNAPLEGIALVTGGEMHLSVNSANGYNPQYTTLGAGSALTAFDLYDFPPQTYHLRVAGNQPAEILYLDGTSFNNWLNQTPSARTVLQEHASRNKARITHNDVVGPRTGSEAGI